MSLFCFTLCLMLIYPSHFMKFCYVITSQFGSNNLDPGVHDDDHDESSTLVLMEVGVEDMRVGVGDGIPGESTILRGDTGCVKGLESRDDVSWIVTSVSA